MLICTSTQLWNLIVALSQHVLKIGYLLRYILAARFQLENWKPRARLETFSARLDSARDISARTDHFYLPDPYAGSVFQLLPINFLFLDSLRMSTKWLTVKFFSIYFPLIANLATMATIFLANSVMSLISCFPLQQLSHLAPEFKEFHESAFFGHCALAL